MRRTLVSPRPVEPVRWQGWLAHRDPRGKILVLVMLAFAFSAITRPALLPVMVVTAIGIAALCGMAPRELARRLRHPSLVIIVLVGALPFMTDGRPALNVGPLVASAEGLNAAALITVRFLAIFTLACALPGSSPLADNLRALRALGLPRLMTDMALLLARYIDVVRHDLRQMQLAMRLRGHRISRPSIAALRGQVWLIAGLLLRSHERAEGVYLAMRARGHGEHEVLPPKGRFTPADYSLVVAAAIFSTGLVVLEAHGGL